MVRTILDVEVGAESSWSEGRVRLDWGGARLE